MKKFNYILLSLLLILLTGCSTKETLSTNEPASITEISEATTTEETQMTETEEVKSKYPEYVEDIYSRFSNCIAENFPQFELGDVRINRVEGSKFYEIYIHKDSKNIAYISVQEFNDDLIQRFKLRFYESSENSDIKDAILCAVIAIDSKSPINESESIATELINNFDGVNKGELVTIADHSIYLQTTLGTTDLIAVSAQQINRKVDLALYKLYDKEAYKAPLNKGSLAYVNGTILEIMENDDGSHCITVLSGEDIYLIYYPFDNFLEFFEGGQSFTFYGQISTYTEPYTGRLFLHYCE